MTETHRCTIFLHGMSQFMVLGILAEEETRLAHVKVKTFQAAIAETDDRIFFADVAFRLVFGGLSCGQTMHYWKPNETLRFMLEPSEEMLSLDRSLEKFTVLIDASAFEAGSD